MPKAHSKTQRRAAGMATAIQKGEMKAVPGTASAEMAKMAPEDLQKIATQKEKGLPLKVKHTPTGAIKKKSF